MTPKTAIPPTIHQIALDFFRGATAGSDAGGGAQCCRGDCGVVGRAGGADTGAEGLLAGGNEG